jgi:alpha-L-fucosidase
VTTALDAPPASFVRPTDFRLPGGEWFPGAGFGLFVHWDHASQQGIEISWPLVGRSIIPGSDGVEDSVTVEEYQSTAATFDPVEWAIIPSLIIVAVLQRQLIKGVALGGFGGR